MNPELEELLRGYDALINANPAAARRIRDEFEAHLDSTALKIKINKETLRDAVRRKYLLWVRANQKPPTIPPTA